jgi:hypothetical protein
MLVEIQGEAEQRHFSKINPFRSPFSPSRSPDFGYHLGPLAFTCDDLSSNSRIFSELDAGLSRWQHGFESRTRY